MVIDQMYNNGGYLHEILYLQVTYGLVNIVGLKNNNNAIILHDYSIFFRSCFRIYILLRCFHQLKGTTSNDLPVYTLFI